MKGQKTTMRKTGVWTLGLLLLVFIATSAVAADLQYAIFHPKTDILAAMEDKWMEEVTKRTAGRVKFKPAYAGSLVSLVEAFDAVQSGTVEMAMTNAAVLSGKISDVSPFEPLGAYPEDARYANLMKEVEPILASLFNRHNVTYLWSTGTPGVSNLCRTKFIKTPEDYKGLKVRVAGRWQTLQVRTLGGSAVAIDPGSLFQALQLGTVDSTYFVNNLALSFKIYEVAKFVAQYQLPVNLNIHLMNKKVFSSLSAEDQKIIQDVSRQTTATALAPVVEAQAGFAAKMKELGANIYTLTAAERKAFHDAWKPIYEEMRKSLGDDGKKLLTIMEKYR